MKSDIQFIFIIDLRISYLNLILDIEVVVYITYLYQISIDDAVKITLFAIYKSIIRCYHKSNYKISCSIFYPAVVPVQTQKRNSSLKYRWILDQVIRSIIVSFFRDEGYLSIY